MVLSTFAVLVGLVAARKIGVFSLIFLSALFAIAGIALQPFNDFASVAWGLAPMVLFQLAAFLRLLLPMVDPNNRLAGFWNKHSWWRRDAPEKAENKLDSL